MNNRIKDLNTYVAYTDINLIKQNLVGLKLVNLDKIITTKLSSSKMKLFVKYVINKIDNYNEDENKINRDIILNDIQNFRKYYKDFSFALNLEEIKNIFIKNKISLEQLIHYIDSLDYLWVNDLDETLLHNGILIEKNKYHNILTDLKPERIPKELIYKYPICLLFKFYKTINDQIIRLEKPGKLDRFSLMLTKLEKMGYISRYHYNDEDFLDFHSMYYRDNYLYNGYCGNYKTYYTFKALLLVYLNGINIYNYQGKYYSYEGLQKVYDIKSLEHSKFINDNNLRYTNNVDEAFEDAVQYHPEITKLSCQCIDVQDLENSKSFMYPLARLKLIFKANRIYGENKNIIINPLDTITMCLSDFL